MTHISGRILPPLETNVHVYSKETRKVEIRTQCTASSSYAFASWTLGHAVTLTLIFVQTLKLSPLSQSESNLNV